MKKSFKVLFSLFMFLMVMSFTNVNAKDVIINIDHDGNDTNTIEGVNPSDLGTIEYQRAAYEFQPDGYGGGILKLLNAGDTYYIHNEFVVDGWDGSLTINDEVNAKIARLTSTKDVDLYVHQITLLNADMNKRFSISGIESMDNATVKASRLSLSTYDDAVVTNSDLTASDDNIDLYSYNGLVISNTVVKAPEITAYLKSVDNVKLYADEGTISFDDNDVNKLIVEGENIQLYDVKGFKDSNVKVESIDANVDVATATIDNSLIQSQTLAYPGTKLTVKKSIIKLGSNDTSLNQNTYVKEIELIDSYFEAETDHNGLTSIPFFSTDTDLAQYAAYDEDGNVLTPANVNNKYLYNDATGQTAKHIFIAPLVKVTFKVENGTWADGTTDDKEVTSYQFGSLNTTSVPTGMKANSGYTNGSWDKEIVYDLLDGNYTYTYKFVKTEVGDVVNEENPSTGDKTLIYAIVLFGSTCGIVTLRKYKKRLG